MLDKTLENELNQIIAADESGLTNIENVTEGLDEELLISLDDAIDYITWVMDEINTVRENNNLIPIATIEISLGGEED